MLFLLISVHFLWMGVNSHAISTNELQINNSTSDIYEIKEDKTTNTITFVNPKTDQQTLREIVYYHLIEKPYEQNAEPEQDIEEGPDVDETVRPFTNSHGFPFLEALEEEQEKDTDIVEEEDEEYIPSKLEETSQEEESDPDEVVYEYYYEEIDDEKTEGTPDNKKIVEAKSTTERPVEFAEIEKGSTDDIKEEIKVETVTIEPLEDTRIKDEVTNQELPTTTPAKEIILENKAKHARSRLFERIKERYYSKINQTENNSTSTPVRRKREINIMDIPEAPKLGPLNYDSLPPYLRAMLSTERPQQKSRTSHSSSEEENLQEIRHKMERMMAKLRSGGGSDESIEELDEQPAPRTYGMNLTEDHGYVWNDMWTKPGVHFDVDASESGKDNKKPDSEEQEEPKEDNDGKSEESKEITEDKHESDERWTEHDNNSKIDEEKSDEIDEHNEVSSKEDNDGERDHNNDNDESENDKIVDDKHGDEEKPEDKSAEDEDDTGDMGRKRHKDKKETMDELLEDEKFWKWLTDWTTVYTDVLTDHIKDAVQEEVSSQMKPYIEDHKDKDTPRSEDKEESDKNEAEKENNGTDSETANSDKSDNEFDSEPTKCEKKEDSENEKTTSDEEKTDDNLSEEDKNIKDPDNIEKEESANLSKENKTESANKKKPEHTSIESQNIYGNTVGSEKVTNIFIFYPNSDASKLINDIKDSKDSKVNVFEPETSNNSIDERINEPDVDKDKKSIRSDEGKNKKDKINADHEKDKTVSTVEKKEENENNDLITESPVDKEKIEPSKDLTNSSRDDTVTSTEIPNITKQPDKSVSTEKTEIGPSTESIKVDISTESNTDATKKETFENENKDTEKDATKVENENKDTEKDETKVENENKDTGKDETKVEKGKDEMKDNNEQNETSTQRGRRNDESESSTKQTVVNDSKSNSEEKISDPML